VSNPQKENAYPIFLLPELPNPSQIAPARQCGFKRKRNPLPRKVPDLTQHQPATRTVAASGENGDIPFAIKSAWMKFWQLAYSGRNVLANVVFLILFGPAMT